MILRFIYCGKIDLEKLQGPDILKLLNAVDEINIETLTKYIQEYLTEHQDEFLQQNPIEIFEAAQHFAIFSGWIEKKNDSYYNGATIVIVKISNSEQIVGGYNPLYWHSGNTFMTTYDSFIFSFANKNNLQNAKLLLEDQAIFGPAMLV
ncbi:unnamed protein product [Rhizophagus irregularis]|nr:unnamed protein product [Rhizophagus irregularis]